MNKVLAITISTDSDPQTHEDTHVHAIYDRIASHFSSTRYKPWPIIAGFLGSLDAGWIGLDAGTGNGKYLGVPGRNVWMIGLDRSKNLLEIARHAGSEDKSEVREVVLGDILGGCWRTGIFDYAISVATIHHLATQERRKNAVKRLLQAVSPTHGRIMIYVWAIEQDELSKRKVPISAAVEEGQDVFVPWALTPQDKPKPKNRPKKNEQHVVDEPPQAKKDPQVFNRYYHMFAKGELQKLVLEAARELHLTVGTGPKTSNTKGVEIVQEGWERSNYYVELRCWRS